MRPVQGSAQGLNEKGGLESFEGAFLKQLPARLNFYLNRLIILIPHKRPSLSRKKCKGPK
jgi:hypothetical protein